MHTYDVDKLVTYNQFSLFIVGAGGFGGKRGSDYQKVNKLARLPSILILHDLFSRNMLKNKMKYWNQKKNKTKKQKQKTNTEILLSFFPTTLFLVSQTLSGP